MTEFLIIVMMIIIGAIIGGVTNSLAIKMLFRPHQAKYIKNVKLPLTPGLIPKRRDELARQLGRMVVEHLLTPAGIRKKFDDAAFRLQLTNWAQQEVSQLLNKEESIKDVLAKIGIYLNEQELREKIATWTENQYHKQMETHRSIQVRDLVNNLFTVDEKQGIEQVTSYIQTQLGTYLQSTAANEKLTDLIESYLSGKGFLGNMITSFVGQQGLADHIQPVLVEYAQSEEAKTLLNQLLTNEYEKLVEQPIGDLEAKIGARVIGQTIGKVAAQAIPLENWLNASLKTWSSPFQKQILSHIVPTIITRLMTELTRQIEPMMKQLNLEEIVEKEVASFPIERVEELVLAISKKEFKLITYLGALLGGIIGLVQGVIVIFIG